MRVKMSQAAGTDPMIPRLSRYTSDSGRKLKIYKTLFLIPTGINRRELWPSYLKFFSTLRDLIMLLKIREII